MAEIEIKSNALAAALELDGKGKLVLALAKKATIAASRVLYDEDRKQVNVIYARVIPKGKGRRLKGGKRGPKKALWKRTGMLRRGEKLTYPNALESLIANANDTPYAVPRHELNKPGADGVTRHDPWRTKTVEVAQGRAVAAFEKVIEDGLK